MKKLLILACLFFLAISLTGCLPQKGGSGGKGAIKEVAEAIPASWQTYEDVERGFKFRYPDDWSFEVIVDRADFLSLSLKKEDPAQGTITVYTEEMAPSYSINVVVKENKKGLTGREARLSQFSESARSAEEAKLEDVIVAGVTGVKCLEGAAPASGPSTMIFVGKGQQLYQLTYSALAKTETHEQFMKEFNLLLQSIEFTN